MHRFFAVHTNGPVLLRDQMGDLAPAAQVARGGKMPRAVSRATSAGTGRPTTAV